MISWALWELSVGGRPWVGADPDDRDRVRLDCPALGLSAATCPAPATEGWTVGPTRWTLATPGAPALTIDWATSTRAEVAVGDRRALGTLRYPRTTEVVPSPQGTFSWPRLRWEGETLRADGAIVPGLWVSGAIDCDVDRPGLYFLPVRGQVVGPRYAVLSVSDSGAVAAAGVTVDVHPCARPTTPDVMGIIVDPAKEYRMLRGY